MNLPTVTPSPCCEAPSTTMTPKNSVARYDGTRRCVRCMYVFSCRIDIGEDQEEVMRIRSVGQRMQLGQKWKLTT